MGRFQPPSSPDDDVVEIVLRGLPVHVLVASREHHDGLMREFRLLALSGKVDADHAPARLVELVNVLGQQFAAARTRRDAEVDLAIAQGLDTIDQVSHVPAAATRAAVVALRGLLAEADDFCRDNQLLTLPRSPLLVRFADWYFDQFVDQAAGHPPVPWDGPLHP